MTFTLKPFTPDCGHTVTPTPGSIGTGKATDPQTGRTMCYPCAEAWEQEKIKSVDVYGAYLTERRPNVLTTWTGGVLAKVTSYSLGSWHYTPNGGRYRLQYLQATTPDGARWYGCGNANDELITIRRRKS